MSAQTHGTNSGYVQHYGRGEKPCAECLTAHRAYQKAYSAARHVAIKALVETHRDEYQRRLEDALAEVTP